MTPTEIRDALRAIASNVGPKAEISIVIGAEYQPNLAIYPNGITGTGRVSVDADTWEELFHQARMEWDRQAALHHKQTIRAIAFKIIEATEEMGRCTEQSLRAEFDPSTIKRFGAVAVAEANRLAGNGPFSIVPSEPGNRRDGDTDGEVA
ncbi:hypothetical protein [Microvirga zambiensis]|uniref:hypothetical protein n=1 Tax=Microvirga zambiensis TaxID=1402137 RepID=UPI00191D3955|nr:hypothetical protein [Microvirga zambiensis]